MAAGDGAHRFRLYVQAPPPPGLFPAGAEVRVIGVPRLWTHIGLGWETWRRPPDVLFVPAHVLPLIYPRRSLVTVHDLGYLYFPEAHPPRQRWYLDRSTRWHTHTAAHLLADSAATKRDLVEQYQADPDKITVAYPGLDPSVPPATHKGDIDKVDLLFVVDNSISMADKQALLQQAATVLDTPRELLLPSGDHLTIDNQALVLRDMSGSSGNARRQRDGIHSPDFSSIE